MSTSYSDDYAATHGRFSVVPAVYLLLRRGDEVLLQLRAGTGYFDGHWACGAAGHVDAGETVVAAVLREAAEELGVAVREEDLELVTLMQRTDGTDRPIEQRFDVFFQTRRWRGEPRAIEPDKAAEIAWFPLAGLPDAVVPHERLVLDALAAGGAAQLTFAGF